MSLLTFGLGVSGTIGGGAGGELEVVLEEPDAIIVSEAEEIAVQMEDADFDVKIIEKITTIVKE